MIKAIEKVVADSSFYLCFLDDINEPKFLYRIIAEFDFYITPIVEGEIKFENNKDLSENKQITRVDNFINFGEILKPFLTKDVLEKGEHEIIGLGFHFYQLGIKFYIIIDDDEARDFIRNNLDCLLNALHGTVGLIGLCHCDLGIFTKEETLITFNKIENSKFRISKNILYEIKARVEGC